MPNRPVLESLRTTHTMFHRFPQRLTAALLGFAIPTLIACSGSTGTPQVTAPGASVGGDWTGQWTEDVTQAPATGSLSFDLVQNDIGDVTGFITFGGIACLSSANFNGRVLDTALRGTAREDDVVVEFQIDVSDSETSGQEEIRGTFEITEGAGCASLGVVSFEATPTPAPFVLDSDGTVGAAFELTIYETPSGVDIQTSEIRTTENAVFVRTRVKSIE